MAVLHRACAVSVALVSASGCALLVGSIDGTYVAHDDAGTKDAGVDRSSPHVDAGHDATSADSSSEDAHHDAGHEAAAAHDSGHDAGHVVDAAPEGGFCARYQVPTGAAFICDDFDEDAGIAALGPISTYGNGSAITFALDAWASPPRSALLAVDPTAAMGGESGAYWRRSLAAGTTYTLDFDVNLPAFVGAHNQEELGGFLWSSGAALVLSLGNSDAGLVTSAGAGEIQPLPLDGGDNYVFHPAASVSLQGWSHVTMSVTNGTGGASDSITVGGVIVDANYNLGPGFFVGDATAAVGWYYTQAPGERAALVDNVVLLIQ
jgi:hypothetical protein